MSANLRWLLWAVCLIVALNFMLNQQDGLHELEDERKTLETLKARETRVTTAVVWPVEVERATLVRTAWMERLPLYSTRGLLNAGVLESMGAICKDLKLACQVAMNDEAPAATKPAASAAAGLGTRKLGNVIPMVSSTGVKLTVAFQPEALVALLNRLESGDQLRTIERISVTGSRMEFTMRIYAVDTSRAVSTGAAL